MNCPRCQLRPQEVTMSTVNSHYTLCYMCAVSEANRLEFTQTLTEAYKDMELLNSMLTAVPANGDGY